MSSLLQKTISKAKLHNNSLAIKLNKVCVKLDNDYLINKGGCCYVAYLLSELLKHDGYHPKLIIYDGVVNAKSLETVDISCNHYCIKLGNAYINAGEFKNDSYYNESVVKNYSDNTLLKHYQECSWNSTYDTKNNSKIAEILKAEYFGITKNLRKRRKFCKSWK